MLWHRTTTVIKVSGTGSRIGGGVEQRGKRWKCAARVRVVGLIRGGVVSACVAEGGTRHSVPESLNHPL